MPQYFFEGFLLQASLILALGAQNLFVLNSGLKKQKHLLVALVASICDTLLILIGVLGVAAIFLKLPLLKIVFGIAGVSFLAFYGIKKFREGICASINDQENLPQINSKKVIYTTLAFSLLNPHVYLDTIVLIGGYSSKYSSTSERLSFGAGASFFSILWFFALSILASKAHRFLKSPKAMKNISLFSGLILFYLSIKLGIEVYGWLR